MLPGDHARWRTTLPCFQSITADPASTNDRIVSSDVQSIVSGISPKTRALLRLDQPRSVESANVSSHGIARTWEKTFPPGSCQNFTFVSDRCLKRGSDP